MGPLPLPWLIPYDLHLGTGIECYRPMEKKLHRIRFPAGPAFPGTTLCMASSSGWLLMLEDIPTYDDLDLFEGEPIYTTPFILNPLTRSLVLLPMLPVVPGDLCFGALSSSPYDPDCTVLLVSRGYVLMCRPNHPGDGWSWWKERIDSALYRDGKFYCISRNHALSTPKVLRLSMDASTLDLPDGSRYRLMEIGGELILIVVLYRLEGFQVFRADLSGEKWVKKMDLLGDHVLFLDEFCSQSLLASDVGCKKNRIYCTHGDGYHIWRVFDLDSGNWIHEETTMHEIFRRKYYSGCWFLPTLA